MYDADIKWKPSDRGGKLLQPFSDTYFCTTTLKDEKGNKSSWSIKLLFTQENPLKAKLVFLFDNYPKNLVKKGDAIELLEGPNIVGYATVINN